MKKIVQRVGSVLCCCLICLQFMVRPAAAIAVADDLLFATLASLAITSGVTFTTIETFDPVVTAIKDKMNENGITDEDIQGYISDGTRLVYDVGDYAWKTVVDIPDGLWWGVQQAVSALYDVGTVEVSDNYATVTTLGLIDFTSIVPLTFYDSNNNPTYSVVKYGSGYAVVQGLPTSTIVISGHDDAVSVSGSWQSYSRCDFYFYKSDDSYYSITCSATNYFSSYSQSSSVYGDISVAASVDQADYDWSNEATQTKVVEFPSTYNGDPDSDDEDSKKLVYWPDIEKYLQGKDASDITSEDTSGIEDPAAQAQADPSEAVSDYTDPPEAGSESNTSLKGLLFSKFPFCIPWDIKNVFNLLVAAPTPPEWEIDLVPAAIKSRCGISGDTTWHINMDGMEVIGTVCRFTSTVGFCLALAIATRRIIHS